MGLRRLRGRLDQLQGEANQTMAMAQALIGEARDGFKVTLRVRFTKGLSKFLWMAIKSLATGNDAPWEQEFPAGLPIELHAQVDLNED